MRAAPGKRNGGGVDAWTARLDRASFESGGIPRVMMYCASNVGLGHLHQLLRVAAALRAQIGEMDLLLVTDTQNLTAEEIHPGIGIVRLPQYEFIEGTFKNRASGLSLEKRQLRDLRAGLILAAAGGFQPHAIVMDTNPHGKRNELEPMLRQLAKLKRPPLRVLQMRDLPFPPEEESRMKAGARRVAADFDLYDELLVAGDPAFFDLAIEYGWPKELGARLQYVGFILPPSPHGELSEAAPGTERAGIPQASASGASPKAVALARWETEGGAASPGEKGEPAVRVVPAAPHRRRIIASMGGGWELETFGRAVLEAYLYLFPEGGHGTTITLVTGPAVDKEAVAELAAQMKGRPDIRIERYTRDFDRDLRTCDLAILQAGFTLYQVIETDIPLLIYSRDYSTREQQVRAERFARFDGVGLLQAEDMAAGRLAERMRSALEAPRAKRETGFGFRGAETAANVISEWLRAAL